MKFFNKSNPGNSDNRDDDDNELESRYYSKVNINCYNDNSNYALYIDNMFKTYYSPAGEVPALSNISFTIKKGEFVSIVGPSGSGKSTLLNVIGALDKPTKGKVFIDGIDIFDLKSNQIAHMRNKMIGFIFQSYNLINRTSVQKNIEIPSIIAGMSVSDRRRRSSKLLDVLGIKDKAHDKPSNLSGGQQQRVAIARALINNPEIILADEPTGNLDTKTGLEVFYLLKMLSKKFRRTIIVVTHNHQLAKETDRTIHILDGRVKKDVTN